MASEHDQGDEYVRLHKGASVGPTELSPAAIAVAQERERVASELQQLVTRYAKRGAGTNIPLLRGACVSMAADLRELRQRVLSGWEL